MHSVAFYLHVLGRKWELVFALAFERGWDGWSFGRRLHCITWSFQTNVMD